MSRFSVVLLALPAFAGAVWASDIDAPPIRYSTAPDENVTSRLIKKIDSGTTSLPYEQKFGYLRAFLKEMKVPETSQVLVFTKTSLQRHRISPTAPRAIYFNDDVYVGFCQKGDVAEVSAVDPNLGTVFYTLNQKDKERPRLTRQTETCLICHASSQNQGLPGHLVRSVFSDSMGLPILASGTYRIDQTSPLKQRWGGWYVSGTSGKQAHLGNLTFEERTNPEDVTTTEGLNVTDLSKYFKTSNYLTPHSDIVALMVMEHQAQMHNLITRASYFTRQALYEEAELNKALGRKEPGHTDSTISRIKNAGEPLVRYMLFSGETELTDKIQGTSGFAAEFAKRGPFDKKGRSLREFDLESRLFKYPCSYLIYSSSFDALPKEVKDYIMRRLWEVLTEKDMSPEFAHLLPRDRRAIREILRDTKPDLPRYWREGN
jgi:hypothetical protein